VITLPLDTPAPENPAPRPPAPEPPDQPAADRSPAPAGRTAPADAARLLPDVSRDETDEGWSERPDRSDDDRLLDEVPPHHVG
jgi:hypothetical protein